MYMHFLRKHISSDNQDYWSLLLQMQQGAENREGAGPYTSAVSASADDW